MRCGQCPPGCRAVPNFAWLEARVSPTEDLGFQDPELFPPQLEMDGDRYIVPHGPGLGVEVNEEKAAAQTFEFWEGPHLIHLLLLASALDLVPQRDTVSHPGALEPRDVEPSLPCNGFSAQVSRTNAHPKGPGKPFPGPFSS